MLILRGVLIDLTLFMIFSARTYGARSGDKSTGEKDTEIVG